MAANVLVLPGMTPKGRMATPTIASISNDCLLDCQSPLRMKLVFLGASCAGKSSFVCRLVKDKILEYQEATIGAAFVTYARKVDNRTVKFEMWDTSGPERYDSLAPMYYRGAHAAIVLYGITSMHSFDKAKFWVKELQSHASPNIVIALSGNMADLAGRRQVQFKEAQVFAQENNLLFMETSALTAQNVTEIFVAVAMKAIQAAYKENGWSPLMVASQKGQPDAVMALIETGAGISQTNKDIKKAQDVAVKNGHENIVKLLEACKTNIFRHQFHVMYEIKEQQIRQQKEETEKKLRDVRQQNEETEKQLQDVRQQKEETEKQLRDVRQQKEETEKQLQEARQQKEQTEKQFRDVRQGKEEAEKQLDDVKKNSEKLLAFVRDNQTKTEQQLRHMWQQNEQTEQQLHEMRQQKEQAEQQLHDMRQQKGEMKEQIDAYKKRLKATESMLVTMQLKNKSLEQESVQQSDTSQITQTANFIYYSLLNSSVPSSADETEHP